MISWVLTYPLETLNRTLSSTQSIPLEFTYVTILGLSSWCNDWSTATLINYRCWLDSGPMMASTGPSSISISCLAGAEQRSQEMYANMSWTRLVQLCLWWAYTLTRFFQTPHTPRTGWSWITTNTYYAHVHMMRSWSGKTGCPKVYTRTAVCRPRAYFGKRHSPTVFRTREWLVNRTSPPRAQECLTSIWRQDWRR